MPETTVYRSQSLGRSDVAPYDHAVEHSPERQLKARLECLEKGRVYVVLPFDPEKLGKDSGREWGDGGSERGDWCP
jgi:hypothetical protein